MRSWYSVWSPSTTGRAIAQNGHQMASTKTSVGLPFAGSTGPVEATRAGVGVAAGEVLDGAALAVAGAVPDGEAPVTGAAGCGAAPRQAARDTAATSATSTSNDRDRCPLMRSIVAKSGAHRG